MTDLIIRLYLCAEALSVIAKMFPEQDGGFAHILNLLAHDLKDCASLIDNSLPPK